MKMNFNIEAGSQRSPAGATKAEGAQNLQPSTFNLQPSQRGIALIITLILLSVTLVMAVAFLAISRRESGSVTTSSDTTAARLAADSALANAEAQIIANVFADTNAPNPYSFGLFVSTNYINANGFDKGVGGYDPTNINYDFLAGGGTLNQGEFLQNVANLLYLPRPPVFIVTNQQTGSNEFRYYLDLNRNGRFEDTGAIAQTNNFNNPLNATNPEIGDPQWIGVLEHPDAPHGPNNKFISRYAFIAVPANSLDWNYIHNQTFDKVAGNRTVNPASGGDVFFRNQGVGSWEINLAAFLADVNYNEWDPSTGENTANDPYTYQQWEQPDQQNLGRSFDDARALLAWRYANNYDSLFDIFQLFNANGQAAFQNNIDLYSDGPLMATPAALNENLQNLNLFWAGSDNTNHFFDLTADLFDQTKTSTGVSGAQVALGNYFTGRLLNAGVNTFGGSTVSTYDRYTYYRMLAQLGTDSSAESAEQNKINLNYANAVAYTNGFGIATNIVFYPDAETNFTPWIPIQFFTIAANQMLFEYSAAWFKESPSNYLATYYGILNYTNTDPNGIGLINFLGVPNILGLTNDQVPSFGITNIPIYVNGQFVYSSAINRVLQLAANIYDATTSRSYDASGFSLPTLFEPLFSKVANGSSFNVYINGFQELFGSDMGLTLTATQPRDLSDTNVLNTWNPLPGTLVYGVPIIVGAKKGLPNFNEFSMASSFQMTRKLQLTRGSTNQVTDPTSSYKINQMFICSITNLLGVECWNSYVTNYPRATTIAVSDHVQITLTNDLITGMIWPSQDVINFASMLVNNWPGTGTGLTINGNSYVTTNFTTIELPPASYIFKGPLYLTTYHFHPIGTNGEPTYEVNPNGLPQPHWGLLVTNNLQVVVIDNATGRAIDYVQLRGPTSARDLTAEILAQPNPTMWLTNFVSGTSSLGNLPEGVNDQLEASESYSDLWSQQDEDQVKQEIDGFLKFLHATPIYGYTNAYGSTNLQIQAPYTPTATTILFNTFQANDPLVHYMASDLFDSVNGSIVTSDLTNVPATVYHERYQPWGKSTQMANYTPDISPWNLALKDPLTWGSDYWDFPTNKFPTVGWLGRVHRGTPWQTVYLKSSPIDTNTWVRWTGNTQLTPSGQYFDAANAMPTNDWLLFDLFTTVPNDNATHGQLSVNAGIDGRPSLAAWSAIFSGVMALSNSVSDSTLNTVLQSMASSQKYHIPILLPPPSPYVFSFTANPINPAGSAGASSPLEQLAAGINATRLTVTNADGLTNVFEHVGDILGTPQLTEQSPFLHWNNAGVLDAAQQDLGISDEMYEWLPQQMMSLVRDSSAPRYVIYCYGQTLKPAPNGIVTSGGQDFFGMVTNYQVVAETATRAVVRVDDANTPHPHVVIESFNLLPPD